MQEETISEEKMTTSLISAETRWFNDYVSELKPDQPTHRQRIGEIAGLISGGISGVICGPLGYDFGMYIADQLNVTDPGSRNFYGYYFGGTAALALVALSARISAKVWSDMLAITPKYKQSMMPKELDLAKISDYALIFLATFAGTLSSMPTVYITHQYFVNSMGYGVYTLDIPTFLSLSTVRSWSLYNLVTPVFASLGSKILNRFSSGEKKLIRDIRGKLIEQLQQSISIINSLTDDEIKRLISAVFTDEYSGTQIAAEENVSIFNKVATLFNPSAFKTSGTLPKPEVSYVKYIFDFLGVTAGILTPYASYPIGVAVSDSLCDALNIQDTSFREHSARTFGVCSYMGLAALSAYASKISFEKFYFWGKNLPKNTKESCQKNSVTSITCSSVLKQVLEAIVMVVALGSSTPRAQLNQEYISDKEFYKPIFVISALISGFSTDYWGIEQFIADYFKKKTDKQLIVQTVTKIKNDIASFDDNHVFNIYQNLSTTGLIDQGFFAGAKSKNRTPSVSVSDINAISISFRNPPTQSSSIAYIK